ncbi:unnamed protein product [Cuscuta epithymum]|uniref:Uncharacterized protein n=1 Tax=Cuscuta epithymum TaxID=186058 RepID=A0AAV0G5F8_9ASTE|nr:unnamed protein product [Cuscuta epithymum]
MCIAVFEWRAHPLYPFLMFLNRDEYHDRPTKALGRWEEDGEIVGGRDCVAGGTWLGCTKGKIAFLTNVREKELNLSSSQSKSRGELPLRFLKSNKSPHDFAEELMGEADLFGGFNLVVVDLCSMIVLYMTNRPKGRGGVLVTEVSPGIHVLTNATLDSPWPKAQRLQKKFKLVLDEYSESEIPVESVAKELMIDTTKDAELPGVYSPELEFHLSSIFVEAYRSKGVCYGTRSTSALAVDNCSEVKFYERSLMNGGSWEERTMSFKAV